MTEHSLYEPPFPEVWPRRSLFSLATWTNGLAFRNIHFTPSGRPVIKIAEVKNGLSQQTKYTKQSFNEAVHVHSGDLIFSWSGQPETSIDAFWWRGNDGWLNQHLFRVVALKGVDQVFLFYLLRYLKPTFVRIARNKQTTGLGHVTRKDLEALQVGVPPLPDQRAIAEVLGALDDKTEANRRVIERSEQLAGCIATSVTPSVPLAGLAEVRRQMVPPASFAGARVDHFSLPAFDESRIPVREDGDGIKSGKFLLEEPAVLVSKLNPHIPRVWLARPEWGVRALTSTEFVVLVPTADCDDVELLWAVCGEPRFCEQLVEMVKGTTGSHQRVATEDVLGVLVPSPQDFSGPMLKTITTSAALAGALRRESIGLARVRDNLLPKLLSGELRVRGAGDLVSEAV